MAGDITSVVKKAPIDQEVLAQTWPILLGLLVLYVPTYVMLASGPWQKDAYAHGPLVASAVLWLVWRKRHICVLGANTNAVRWGAGLLAAGLVVYALGRSQSVMMFEVGSQVLVLAGVVLIFFRKKTLLGLAFPLLFLMFLVPLPSMMLDAATGPLKEQVSMIVDDVLYMAGFPIARSGVVLSIGPYQLLVADACSGLNSMYALTAVGALYVYLRQHQQGWQKAVLLCSIIPIAFVANIFRVVALALITYYAGDKAGQGFLHDFAGIAEFMLAVIALFILDAVMKHVVTRKKAAT